MTEQEKIAEAERRCYTGSVCWKKLSPQDKKWVTEQWEQFEKNDAERWEDFRQEAAAREQKSKMDKMKRELEETKRQLEDSEWRARYRYR